MTLARWALVTPIWKLRTPLSELVQAEVKAEVSAGVVRAAQIVTEGSSEVAELI